MNLLFKLLFLIIVVPTENAEEKDCIKTEKYCTVNRSGTKVCTSYYKCNT